MDGAHPAAGAVAGLTTTRAPISLARRLMEHSPHVFLSGHGADRFAATRARAGRERLLHPARAARQLDEAARRGQRRRRDQIWHDRRGRGRPGGHVAAATSTGGITGKRWGRSRRFAADRRRHLRRRPRRPPSRLPAQENISSARLPRTSLRAGSAWRRIAAGRAGRVLADIECFRRQGGLIAVAPDGEAAWGFTTPAMYRGMADATGRIVAIYSDEDDGKANRAATSRPRAQSPRAHSPRIPSPRRGSCGWAEMRAPVITGS